MYLPPPGGPHSTIARKRSRLKDGSLELNSRYGCTQPSFFDSDDFEGSTPGLNTCSLGYRLEDDEPITLAAMKIGEINAAVCVGGAAMFSPKSIPGGASG